jgi:hypothetical protein
MISREISGVLELKSKTAAICANSSRSRLVSRVGTARWLVVAAKLGLLADA